MIAWSQRAARVRTSPSQVLWMCAMHGALLCLCLRPSPAPAANQGTTPQELRVVIDVSGSMREDDPHNLRVPALRLLTELLPAGDKAGVWTFGDRPRVLIPVGTVDPAWRSEAARAAAAIGSRAPFTNIGKALKAATADWRTTPASGPRSLILLTDGYVDITKDKQRNNAARRALTEEIAPALHRAGVRVYDVGLSDHVDEPLLTAMAERTGGLYQPAHSADALQHVFLHILELATGRNNLPLAGNHFTVDDRISELTLVVFHSRDSNPTQLFDPNGDVYSSQDHPRTMRWFTQPGYDLVTVEKPSTGRWRIDTVGNPDNRVFIVSNLQLHALALPAMLFADEQVFFHANLYDGGRPITRRRLLGLVDTTVQIAHADGNLATWPLPFTAAHANGRHGAFDRTIRIGAHPGMARVTVTASSPTFQRRLYQTVNILPDPVRAELQRGRGIGHSDRIVISASYSHLGNAPLQIRARVVGPDHHERVQQLTVGPTDYAYLGIDDHDAGTYHVDFQVQGITASARPFHLALPEMTFEASPLQVLAANTEAPHRSAAVTQRPAAAPRIAPQRLSILWIVIVALVNLGALAGAVLLYRRLTRRHTAAVRQELEALGGDEKV